MSAESRKQESRKPSEDGVTNRPVVLICVLLSAFYLASLSRAKYKHTVCQLLSNNMAGRSEIAGAFGIPERSISRWLALFKEKGGNVFFSKRQV